MTKKAKTISLVVLLVLIALALRLPGLGQFMTVDEERWMLRSAMFWHKMFREGDPGGTYITTHPGATTMWLSGAGIFLQEARLGFDIDTSNLRHFRLAGTLPAAVAISLLIGLAGWMVMRLLGRIEGFWAGCLLAVEPYFVGMSQVVHLDALSGLFMLAAFLSFILFLRERKDRWAIICGVAGGLAMATKLLPALWLFVYIGAVLAALLLIRFKKFVSFRHKFNYQELVRAFFYIAGIAVLTMWAVWPALWVKDDLHKSFEDDIPSVVTDEHVVLQASREPIAPNSFYVRTWLGRVSVFTLLLSAGMAILAIRAVWTSWREGNIGRLTGSRAFLVLLFIMYIVGFLLLITMIAKKADRYALPALMALSLLAGWGWGAVLVTVKEKRSDFVNFKKVYKVLSGVIGVLLFIQVLGWAPHTIAFEDSLLDVRPLSQQGWGEGLEVAANWLNKHPLADRLTVASWYPGVMRTYFNGQTMSLSSRDDERVGYVVLYRNMYGRAMDDIATDVLDEFDNKEPVYVVYIGGKPYVWVYEKLGLHYFPKHAGEITGEVEVGQTVFIQEDGWNGIDIGMATFSSRNNTENVILHVKEDEEAENDIRTVEVNAGKISDSDWQKFGFQAIEDSAGQSYYVSITSPTSTKGNAVTVRFVDRDVLNGQMLLRRRALREGEKNSDFFRDNDLAYRLYFSGE